MVFSRRIFANLMLVIISILISLLLAELLLQQIFLTNTGTSFQYRIPHPIFGWSLEPGASYRNQMPEAIVDVAYNSKGWRDVEHTLDNYLDVPRVLVLGDSFMEAYSVNFNQSFHTQMKQLMHEKGFDIEVINMGVGGYGTLQEYLVFREIGKLYKPNFVLLGFYIANDVRNNSMELEFLLNIDDMKVKTRPFLSSDDSAVWKVTKVDFDGAQDNYVKKKAQQNAFPRNLIRQSALRQAWRNVKHSIKTPSIKINNDQKHLALNGVHYCQEPNEYTKAWNTTKRIMKQMKKDVESTGSTLLVFSVPALHETNIAIIEKEQQNHSYSTSLCLKKAPGYARLQNILDELNIEYVDLLPGFRKATQHDDINLFRNSDRHWNEKGHALAAELVGFHLIKNLQ